MDERMVLSDPLLIHTWREDSLVLDLCRCLVFAYSYKMTLSILIAIFIFKVIVQTQAN